MGFFVSHLFFWLVVDAVFQPGVITINVDKAPTLEYDRNEKSWAIPAYNNIKQTIQCIELNKVKCLKGE